MQNTCGAFGGSLWSANTPTCFKDIAFADDYTREDLAGYADNPNLTGNIILEGGYGSGKSTIAQIVANERLADSLSVFEINGETWSDDTLTVIENTYAWATANGNIAVVIINEVDRLKDKQFKLRDFLDAHANKLLVIMTTNHLANIDGSIVDRSDVYYVRGFTPQKAVEVAQNVLQSNGYNFEDADLEKLFTRRLVVDEQELSLRQIGRIVDKLAIQNAPQPPKRGTTLRVVK
ncbi:AAA family ATPase [Planktomarina temperata]|nr:AAA family ATPase [Planktomarina temperata]